MIHWVDDKLHEWGRYMKRWQDGIGYPRQSPGAYLIDRPQQRSRSEATKADRLALLARRGKRRKVKVQVNGQEQETTEVIRYMIPQTTPKQTNAWTWPVEDWPQEITQIDRVVIDLPKDLREVVQARYLEPGPVKEKAAKLGIPRQRFYEKLDAAHLRLSYALDRG